MLAWEMALEGKGSKLWHVFRGAKHTLLQWKDEAFEMELGDVNSPFNEACKQNGFTGKERGQTWNYLYTLAL